MKNPEYYCRNPFEYIIDENKVRSYDLPDVLLAKDGQFITAKEQWENQRRKELLADFAYHIYGEIPPAPDTINFQTVHQDDHALNDTACLRKIEITLTRNQKQFVFHLQLFTPKSDQPSPVFLLANNRKPADAAIDPDQSFWPARSLVLQGFAAAILNNTQLAEDCDETFRDGMMQLYPELTDKPHAWRAISTWAYGVIRCVDFLAQDQSIDATRISVVGHSRGGKIALWAAANDTRIAMACVNESGSTGTAIARRKVGETIKAINDQFPYWFNDIYKQYNDREDDLPVDQHMLVALVAPRAVCVGSALEDTWADPRGEYLSTIHASAVYQLYGYSGMSDQLPVTLDGQTLGEQLSYHIRKGVHGLTEQDWQCYIKAARTFLQID
ncbi:MAG TPA: acetylxylan esterase [Phycisphaerales bacterium]|nr:acetylxylan esterase [Phycisphaerales bacterium]HCD31484.1 acetylxylan esterase [Phycisphaerales bacterium]|tara:strand:- start:212 stop:1366 length:1155 start_codon:yes stop_codon:yes gene_type:complete